MVLRARFLLPPAADQSGDCGTGQNIISRASEVGSRRRSGSFVGVRRSAVVCDGGCVASPMAAQKRGQLAVPSSMGGRCGGRTSGSHGRR
eukprot:3465141-Pleurochrysis_carterae.AAC.1